jgi:pimeloyl-ACP methyl ester carboxylesterase
MRLLPLLAAIAMTLSASPQLKDEYARINGIRMHYVTAGKGPLIIFLHGFPEFWYEWKNQLAEFGKDHLAVAPDMRGYNLSDKPAGVDQYDTKLLIEDIRALAEHLGRKKFVLVGHDWGGAVAWLFAAAHPDYVEKLVIVNAPHPAVFARLLRENADQQRASQYMLMFRGEQAEAMLSANNYAMLTGVLKGDAFTDEDRKQYLAAWSQPGALTGGLNYYRASRVGPDNSGAFSGDPAQFRIKPPTLVIWGEKDTALTTHNLEGLEEFVPRLTVKRIPDGTHWVIHEKPGEVNGDIRAFLK